MFTIPSGARDVDACMQLGLNGDVGWATAYATNVEWNLVYDAELENAIFIPRSRSAFRLF